MEPTKIVLPTNQRGSLNVNKIPRAINVVGSIQGMSIPYSNTLSNFLSFLTTRRAASTQTAAASKAATTEYTKDTRNGLIAFGFVKSVM